MGLYEPSIVSTLIPASPVPVIIWGASNASGQGTTAPTGIPILDVPYSRFNAAVTMSRFKNYGPMTWYGVRHGLEVQFSKDMRTAGKFPVVVTCTQNSTSTTVWLDGGGSWPTFRDFAYPTISRAPSAKRHILVEMGGADGTTSFAANMPSIMSQMRALVGPSRFYFLRMNILCTGIGIPLRDSIRAQQATVAAGDSDSELIDTDGITDYAPDNLHYTSVGYDQLGSLAATRVLLQL